MKNSCLEVILEKHCKVHEKKQVCQGCNKFFRQEDHFKKHKDACEFLYTSFVPSFVLSMNNIESQNRDSENRNSTLQNEDRDITRRETGARDSAYRRNYCALVNKSAKLENITQSLSSLVKKSSQISSKQFFTCRNICSYRCRQCL